MTSISTFQKSFIYVQSAQGLENVLRLTQAICQVVGSLQDSPASAKPWGTAVQKIGLSRRFFRFFGYVPALNRAVSVLTDRDESLSGVGFVLPLAEASRSGFMGLYLLLESLTILDAMDVYVSTSAKKLLTESFKFWFYGLVSSFICIIWQLAFYPSAVPKKAVVNEAVQEAMNEKLSDDGSKPEQPQKLTSRPIQSREMLMSDLVAVSCDILIPGSRLGWIPVNDFTVGSFSIVSSLVYGKRRWISVQRSAAANAVAHL